MSLVITIVYTNALREKFETLFCFSSRCCLLILSSPGRRVTLMTLHVEGSVETSVSIPQVGSLLADVSRVAWRQSDLAIRSDDVCKIGLEDVCHSALLCFQLISLRRIRSCVSSHWCEAVCMWLTLTLSKTGPVGVDAIGSQIQRTLSHYASAAMRNP